MESDASTMAYNKLTNYNERLKKLESTDLINRISWKEIEEYLGLLELEIASLDSENSSELPALTIVDLKQRYLLLMNKYKNIVSHYFVQVLNNLLDELEALIIYDLEEVISIEFVNTLLQAWEEFDKVQSKGIINFSLKQRLTERYNRQIRRFTNEYIDQLLPAEIRNSIILIEKTLTEPQLHTLPSLAMWKETAEEKIENIHARLTTIFAKPIERELIKRYGILIKKLRTEVLKLRTYSMPETWCSYLMREGLIHLIKGEFIFYVYPEVEGDIKPLNLSERDILPGGITRQEYNTRLSRFKLDISFSIEKQGQRNASEMERKLEPFKRLYAVTEENVKFAFTELPLLYRDGRILEHLVNKNQDDELLKELYNLLLRKIRHFPITGLTFHLLP